MQGSPVLVTWIATRGDPFERTQSGGPYREGPKGRIPGPTLALLTDPESTYAGRITDVVVLRQGGAEAALHEGVYEDLVAALRDLVPSPRLFPYVWDHDDPTDHAAIYDYLRALLPLLRRQFPGRELVVHLSPGTAAMHTVWVLMAATGFIEQPFTVVQSLRADERRGRPALAPLSLAVDTFFRRWQETRPSSTRADEPEVWDPRQFRSSRLRAVYDEARRIARLRVPALILGERGTGKTTLASWIRLRSPFRRAELDRAWPAVPCGQYTPETMRAELFGYIKGAFTGAVANHEGLLARANGDTLFLDEIGDISRELQRLLVKVVEEGTFQPVGTTEVKRTDLRLLTATNIPLERLREQLDADFLDRIRGFTLTVPPLREVPEELDWLWPVVLTAAARRSGAPLEYAQLPRALHDEVVRALRASGLPGNVRDLYRVAYRFLAARADDEAPLVPRDALHHALQALDGGAPDLSGAASRGLARAFAERIPLTPAALVDGPLDPDRAIEEFKAWFARQILELTRTTRRPLEELTTSKERTLRNWRKDDAAGSA